MNAELIRTLKLRPWQESLMEYLRDGHPIEKSSEIRSIYSAEGFNREFAPKVDMGRRMGHTTLAVRALQEFESVVVAVSLPGMLKQYPREFREDGRVFCAGEKLYHVVGNIDLAMIIDQTRFVALEALMKFRSLEWGRYIELQ